ncbi:unnamed protein product [Soboliphyme baturini]|uniref:Phosphatidylethanolamine-binding protein n=1 Tax=Soboliphyme baturini TaxID=241478 RepID=A0A183IZL1_9BILA|nr:unnamed protein product [Soboliphyme baturini]
MASSLYVVCLLTLQLHFLRSWATGAMTTSEKFTENGVVPDVVSTSPANLLEVKYAGDLVVDLGNTLKPSQVKNEPVHIKWPTESGALYTVIFTDPDAPSRKNPTFREWRHWLIVNVPSSGDISQGEVLTPYMGSMPPAGTGLHRYVFLVYKQPGKIHDDKYGRRSDRAKWSAAKFAAEHNLGSPVAGNFFQVIFTEYLMKVYQPSI